MANANRQQGRRGTNSTVMTNVANSDSGVRISPSSTGSTSNSQRRYVLDVPTSPAMRTSRPSTARSNEMYGSNRTRASADDNRTTYSTILKTAVNYDNDERLSRSSSREYYYRGDGVELRSSPTRYSDVSTRNYTESQANYADTAMEDQEVQALTTKATPDIKDYPINVDANPDLVVRPNNQRLTYAQDIAIRYLRPSTPPPPGPIVIREIRAPPPPPAPPIILRQRPPPPRTPSPVIIREKPPPRPKSVPTTVIRKIIPPPPPPPRKLIIERLPALPPKPRPVIIERWLPYKKQRRQVIHEKAKPLEPMARIKNTIIEWRPPEVEVVKQVKKLGVTQADPQRYTTQHGDKLYATEFVQRKLNELGLQEELALIQEQQKEISKEDLSLEQDEEYKVRQILNGYNRSSHVSRQSHSNGTIAHLVQSSSPSGFIEEYNDQKQTYYRVSPERSGTVMYETNTYTEDGKSSSLPILTEEMLLRSHAENGGRFPSHLLTKLGSQVYDMSSDEVDLDNSERRITTTTTTRYYTVNQNEVGYDQNTDEMNLSSPRYSQESYVQMKGSDLKELVPNYDVYTTTGEKLEGEQVNY